MKSWSRLLKDQSDQLSRCRYFETRYNALQWAIEGRQYSETGWCQAATEAEIRQAEERLGVSLPHSYRSFLKISNGWWGVQSNIYRMLPCQEIAWFRETNPEWISDWLKGVGSPRRVPDEEYLNYGPDQSEGTMRHEYLNGCLQISEIGDISVILLNPIIVDTSGDWETWDFSTFYPGAQRYRNFREFFEAAAAQLRADDMAV